MAHARRLIHAIAVAVCVVALSLTPVQAVDIGYDDLCAGYPRVVPRSSVSFVGYDLEPTVESAAVFVRHLLGRVVITASGTGDVAPSIGATELELESLGFRLRGVFMKHDSVAVSPFGDSSFFVSSSATLQCKSYSLSYINAIQFVLGLFLVWNARYLSRSTAVFFATGVSLGVGLWVLLVVLVVVFQLKNRLSQAVAIAAAGFGTFTVTTLATGAGNLYEAVVRPNWQYFAAYLGFGAVVSFIYLYIKGPPTNPRTQNVIQVAITATGACLLYMSTMWFPAKVGVVVGSFVLPWIASCVCGRCGVCCCCFRCCRRSGYRAVHISGDQYDHATRVATQQELDAMKARIRSMLPVSRDTAHRLIDEAIDPKPRYERRRYRTIINDDGGLEDPSDESDIDDSHWESLRRSPSPQGRHYDGQHW